MPADLHVHTTASDGTLTPEQTVQEAARLGLEAVGIADHDTIAGIEPALAAGRDAGIIVVPAVEINTDFGSNEMHILGYYIDCASQSLNENLGRLRAGRLERGRMIVEKLNEIGLNISMDRVEEIAGGGAVGRPHIARALVEAGYVRSLNSAFGKYLVRGTPSYVPRYKLTPFQAVDIVLQAGGVPVMAHPGTNKHDEMIQQLVDAGLLGLEVYHSDHSSFQAKHYLKIAEKFNLIPTAGSDSHGPNNVKTIHIGHVTCDISIVHRLQAASEQVRQRMAERSAE
jgi:3',5'-nucleoside bisphosphate phosphatase